MHRSAASSGGPAERRHRVGVGLNILDATTVHSKNERIYLPAYIDGVERTARIVREYALAP